MNFYSDFFKHYLSELTPLSSLNNLSISKLLCLIYVTIYTKKLFNNSQYFIDLIEDLTKFDLLSPFHFMLIKYLPIQQLPNLRNFLLNTEVPEYSNLYPGIVAYMKYITENQINIFWEIFSPNLLFQSIYRNDCFYSLTSVLSNLILINQPECFLEELMKHLLNASICINNHQFPKTMTIIFIFIVKQIGFEKFSHFFFQIYPNDIQEVTDYFHLILKGDQFDENTDLISDKFVKFNKKFC